MSANAVRDAETYVMNALRDDDDGRMTIRDVVQEVRRLHAEIEVAQVKVAALNLVSRGRADLDDGWELVVAAEG